MAEDIERLTTFAGLGATQGDIFGLNPYTELKNWPRFTL